MINYMVIPTRKRLLGGYCRMRPCNAEKLGEESEGDTFLSRMTLYCSSAGMAPV